jgi:hypothetical protein
LLFGYDELQVSPFLYKGVTIRVGVLEPPDNQIRTWAEVLIGNKPLQRWSGYGCIKRAKEWIDKRIG